MLYFKGVIPLLSSLSFCTLIFLVLITVLCTYNNNALLSSPSSTISKIVQAAAAISPSSSDSHYGFNTPTTTNIQFPGIIPDNNNPPPTSTSPSSNPASNSPPPPPPIKYNTRARAAIGGPTLNDPNLKVERIVDTGLRRTTSMALL